MKKMAFLVVMAVLLASVFSGGVSVLADDGEDNIKKAGEKVLREKQQMLAVKEAAIDTFIFQIVADRFITGDELISLNAIVDDFNAAKAQADAYLEFYGLATKTTLDEEMVTAVKHYYERGLFLRDSAGKVKNYFVRLVGEDVVVQKSRFIIATGQIFGIIAAILGLVLLVFSFRVDKKSINSCMFLIGFVIFLVSLLFFIIL